MAEELKVKSRRVVLAYWKNRATDRFEVFSNLLLFCDSYPGYSYHTLSNYLSKGKIAFEDEVVRVERMPVMNRRKGPKVVDGAPIGLVRSVRRVKLGALDEKEEDLAYWQSRTAEERLAAVTFLVLGSIRNGRRMNKKLLRRKKLGDHDIK